MKQISQPHSTTPTVLSQPLPISKSAFAAPITTSCCNQSTMSFSDSETSSGASEYKPFRQISRDRKILFLSHFSFPFRFLFRSPFNVFGLGLET